jgi:hypothetical protein
VLALLLAAAALAVVVGLASGLAGRAAWRRAIRLSVRAAVVIGAAVLGIALGTAIAHAEPLPTHAREATGSTIGDAPWWIAAGLVAAIAALYRFREWLAERRERRASGVRRAFGRDPLRWQRGSIERARAAAALVELRRVVAATELPPDVDRGLRKDLRGLHRRGRSDLMTAGGGSTPLRPAVLRAGVGRTELVVAVEGIDETAARLYAAAERAGLPLSTEDRFTVVWRMSLFAGVLEHLGRTYGEEAAAALRPAARAAVLAPLPDGLRYVLLQDGNPVDERGRLRKWIGRSRSATRDDMAAVRLPAALRDPPAGAARPVHRTYPNLRPAVLAARRAAARGAGMRPARLGTIRAWWLMRTSDGLPMDWVRRLDGSVRISRNGTGHAVVGDGLDVLGAGEFRVRRTGWRRFAGEMINPQSGDYHQYNSFAENLGVVETGRRGFARHGIRFPDDPSPLVALELTRRGHLVVPILEGRLGPGLHPMQLRSVAGPGVTAEAIADVVREAGAIDSVVGVWVADPTVTRRVLAAALRIVGRETPGLDAVHLIAPSAELVWRRAGPVL